MTNDETIRDFPNPTSLKSIDCPECGKPLVFHETHEHTFFPFCNKRCKLLDLARKGINDLVGMQRQAIEAAQ